MESMFLIGGTAAVFLLGFFAVKKWEKFWAGGHGERESPRESSGLRIAFESSLSVEAAAGLLNSFSEENPDCRLYLFTGTAEEMKEKLRKNELDFAFVTAETKENMEQKWASQVVWLRQDRFFSEAVGLSVIPLNGRGKPVRVMWKEEGGSFHKQRFQKKLKKVSPGEGAEAVSAAEETKGNSLTG